MTDLLTVQTPFPSISDFAEGMAGRVQANRLILYAAVRYDSDVEVEFQVLLADGSHGLRGRGRVLASHDAWEEQADSRPEEMRYDIVIGEVEYDAMSEIVRDRILQLEIGERHTGDIELPPTNDSDLQAEVEQLDDDGAEPPSAQDWQVDTAFGAPAFVEAVTRQEYAADTPAGTERWPEHGTETVDLGDFEDWSGEESSGPATWSEPPAPVFPRSEPPPSALRPANGAPLARPTRPASWFPAAMAAGEARSSSGLFAHLGAGFPVPTRPPRPDLDPALRVVPATRSTGAGSIPPFAPQDTQPWGRLEDTAHDFEHEHEHEHEQDYEQDYE